MVFGVLMFIAILFGVCGITENSTGKSMGSVLIH